jgi:hypothetical protein
MKKDTEILNNKSDTTIDFDATGISDILKGGADLLGAQTGLIGKISDIFGGDKNKRTAAAADSKRSAETAIVLAALQAKQAKALADANKAKSNGMGTTTIIILVVVVAAVIGGIIYFVKRK